MPLEIACFSNSSASTALHSGADRIELCAGPLSSGGLTPSISSFQEIRSARDAAHALSHQSSQEGKTSSSSPVPIYVMIRPRAGDFCYSDAEFQDMKASMRIFLEAGADGFVFGILRRDAGESGRTWQGSSGGLRVDVRRNQELVEIASSDAMPRPCTFHRAFDEVTAKDTALEELIQCGFSAVLTAGVPVGGVMAGKGVLRDLLRQADGRIKVMPGGGLRSGNLEDIRREVCQGLAGGNGNDVRKIWWHSSAITGVVGEEADSDEIRRLKELLR